VGSFGDGLAVLAWAYGLLMLVSLLAVLCGPGGET
jgi:hypothetical protein